MPETSAISLTGNAEIDEDTFLDLAARLGDEAELLQSRMGILDALPHHLHDVTRESRMTRQKSSQIAMSQASVTLSTSALAVAG